MLPVLAFSLLCRADDVRIAVGSDSATVRRVSPSAPTMRLSVLGRTVTVRFAPHAAPCATRRDSITAELAQRAPQTPPAGQISRSALDASPRLRAPSIHHGSGPVRIEYGVGGFGAESRLEIFDVTGRRVANLSVCIPSPGRGVVWWEAPAGAGMYFARLVRPDAVLLRRIVLLS